MTIELKNNTPEIKDLLHLLNALPSDEVVTSKIKNFATEIRDRALKAEKNNTRLENEIISMYQNDSYSAGRIAEIFNMEKEDIVNILADNEIFCYDYTEEELEREEKFLESITKK
jgi:predicted HTH domain antitoxin